MVLSLGLFFGVCFGSYAVGTLAEKQFFFAQELFEKGNFGLTIKQFEEFIKGFPENENCDKAYYYLGVCSFQKGDVDKSISVSQECISKYPGSDVVPYAVCFLGYVYSREGKYLKTMELFKREVKGPFLPKFSSEKRLREENKDLKQQLGKLQGYREQVEELEKQVLKLQKEIALPKLTAPEKPLESVSEDKELEIKKAIVKSLLEYRGKDYGSQWLAKQLKGFQKKYEGLDFSFEYKDEIYTPAYIQALIAQNSGSIFWGKPEEAVIEEWIRLVSEHPDSKYTLFAYDILGYLYKKRGECTKAIHCFLKCIEDRTKFPEVSEYVSIEHWAWRKVKGGREQERDVAECYEELEDYESAIVYWQKYKDMQEEGSDEAIEAEVKIEILYKLLN